MGVKYELIAHQAQTPFVRDAQISRNADEPSMASPCSFRPMIVSGRRDCNRFPVARGRRSSTLPPSSRIVIAVPTALASFVDELRTEVDDLVARMTPRNLRMSASGTDFRQVSDQSGTTCINERNAGQAKTTSNGKCPPNCDLNYRGN